MQEREEKGKLVELKVYSPLQAVEEIYAGLTADLDEQWTPFQNVSYVKHGDFVSLIFQGLVRPGTSSTEIIAYGKGEIGDHLHRRTRGDTLVFARTREKYPTSETESLPLLAERRSERRSDFLRKIISCVAFNDETPNLSNGEIVLGGLKFSHGSFGASVSVNERPWAEGKNPTVRVGNSAEITQSVVGQIIDEIRQIRASTRF